MADVVICCAGEDRETGRRLEDALRQAGYTVWWNEAAASDFWDSDTAIEQIGKSTAVIAVWSRSSAGSAVFHAQAKAARAQAKLIQASADNSRPPIPFDAVNVALLADWRGEIAHFGWRAIQRDLEALCGRSNGKLSGWIAGSTAFFKSRNEHVPVPATEHRPPSDRLGRAFDIVLPLLALVAVSVGAIGWASGRASSPQPRAAPAAVASRSVPSLPPRPAPPPAPSAAPRPAPLRLAVATPAPAPAASSPKTVRTAARPETSKPAPSRAKKSDRVKARPKKPSVTTERRRAQPPRIKYKYSENMRLFCRGAGQNTPQCRTFRRNTPKSLR